MRYLTVCIFILLTACSDKWCIDPDDFGVPKVTVRVDYNPKELFMEGEYSQIAPWIPSKYRVTGQPLTIIVQNWDNERKLKKSTNTAENLSAWCPWFGKDDIRGTNSRTLSSVAERLDECVYNSSQCTKLCKEGDASCSKALSLCKEGGNLCTETPDLQIEKAPCILTKGVGLYALIAQPGVNPNDKLEFKRRPSHRENGMLHFHVHGLPQQMKKDYNVLHTSMQGTMEKSGGGVFTFQSPEESDAYRGGMLYFKILTRLYTESSGQYIVYIKSGVQQVNQNIFENLEKNVLRILFGTTQNNATKDKGIITKMYEQIIGNPDYIRLIKILLTIYITLHVILFALGVIRVNKYEFIVHIFKISIISVLISQKSWEFFYNHLFALFTDGISSIKSIMYQSVVATGPGSGDVLTFLTSTETLAKLMSIIFLGSGLGAVYCLLYMVVLAFIFVVYLQVYTVIITAKIMTGIIISLFPIFISFILFKSTFSLFENWLKQLVIYAMQPIVLYTCLVVNSGLIKHEIYSSLGFKVCRYGVMGLDKISEVFTWWFPSPINSDGFNKNEQNIPIPESFEQIDQSGRKKICAPYECIGKRYADLPFLDPEKDKKKIEKFWGGDFVHTEELLVVTLLVFVLQQFISVGVSLASHLANGFSYTGGMKSAETSQSAIIGGVGGIIKLMRSKKGSGATRPAVSPPRQGTGGTNPPEEPKLEKSSDKVYTTTPGLRNIESFEAGVIQATEKKTGIKHESIDSASSSKYSNSMIEVFTKFNTDQKEQYDRSQKPRDESEQQKIHVERKGGSTNVDVASDEKVVASSIVEPKVDSIDQKVGVGRGEESTNHDSKGSTNGTKQEDTLNSKSETLINPQDGNVALKFDASLLDVPVDEIKNKMALARFGTSEYAKLPDSQKIEIDRYIPDNIMKEKQKYDEYAKFVRAASEIEKQ